MRISSGKTAQLMNTGEQQNPMIQTASKIPINWRCFILPLYLPALTVWQHWSYFPLATRPEKRTKNKNRETSQNSSSVSKMSEVLVTYPIAVYIKSNVIWFVCQYCLSRDRLSFNSCPMSPAVALSSAAAPWREHSRSDCSLHPEDGRSPAPAPRPAVLQLLYRLRHQRRPC